MRASAPELNYDLRIDLPYVVVAYASWNTLQSLNGVLAARRCRWCSDNAVDRGVRDALRWSPSAQKTASTLSDIGANALTPALTVGLSAILAENDDRFAAVPVDIVLTAEAVSTAGVVAQIVKYSVGRIRPDAHALPPNERPYDGNGQDAYVSFYSGHTSYAFSLAASAGTIASLRHYRGAGWVWAAGMSAATLTGYLRIAADKHYLTDVLSAAVVSSAIGVSVPYFFHRPVRFLVPIRPSIAPVQGGALLTVDAQL